jgi:hypothetical protein
MFRAADRAKLSQTEAIELLIVAAGARGDLGQKDAAVAMLQVRELTSESGDPWAGRLRYAYADALLGAGRTEEAREWFSRAVEADEEGDTDAAERLLELDGVNLEDDDSEDAESDEDAESEDDESDEDDGEDDESDEDDGEDYESDEDDKDYDEDDEDEDDEDEDYDDDEDSDGFGDSDDEDSDEDSDDDPRDNGPIDSFVDEHDDDVDADIPASEVVRPDDRPAAGRDEPGDQRP